MHSSKRCRKQKRGQSKCRIPAPHASTCTRFILDFPFLLYYFLIYFILFIYYIYKYVQELEDLQAAARVELSKQEEKVVSLESERDNLVKLLGDLQKSLLELQVRISDVLIVIRNSMQTRLTTEVEVAKSENEGLMEELLQTKRVCAALESMFLTVFHFFFHSHFFLFSPFSFYNCYFIITII
jgi:hypothetical protein